MRKIILILVVISLLSIECHKDNPCPGAPTNADFTTSNYVLGTYGIDLEQLKGDTFYAPRRIIFNVNDNNVDSCFWIIGSDPEVRTAKTFDLFFEKAYGKVPVKLRVKKKPDTRCHPNDDGIDEITKTITLLPINQHPMFGKYEGSDDEFPNDKYIVEIILRNKFPTNMLYNFPKGCGLDTQLTMGGFQIGIFGHRYFQSDDGYAGTIRLERCQSFNTLNGYLSKDNQTITIKYISDKQINGKVVSENHQFIGKRIN